MKKPRTTTVTPVPAKAGSVSVTVMDSGRIEAIASLARTVEHLARCLASPTQVSIEGCHIIAKHNNPGIQIEHSL